MLFHVYFPVILWCQLINQQIIQLINQSSGTVISQFGNQLFTWSWAPPVFHRHLGCCRSGEPGCCTSFPPDRRRCTCRCNRASCCWWTAGPLSSAASSAQLLSGPNGCSAEIKVNSFYILDIKWTPISLTYKPTYKHISQNHDNNSSASVHLKVQYSLHISLFCSPQTPEKNIWLCSC